MTATLGFDRTFAGHLLSLSMKEKQQRKDETRNNENDAEDDETESVDDCSSNHPFTHHLLFPVGLMT